MSLRILVVDDEPDIRETLQAILQSKGHVVETAANGFEGAEFADKWRPDVIVSDLMMPQMGGLDMVAMIKDKGFQPPVIFLTAFDEQDLMLQGKALGNFEFLTKPVDYEYLFQALEAVEAFKVSESEPSSRFLQGRLFKDLVLQLTPELYKKLVDVSDGQMVSMRRYVIGLIEKDLAEKLTKKAS